MVLVAWMVFAIVVIYLICGCIKFCIKQVTKDEPVQVKTVARTPATNKEEIIKELFGDNVEIFTKFNGISFWVYAEVYGYFYSKGVKLLPGIKLQKKNCYIKETKFKYYRLFSSYDYGSKFC